MAMATITSLQKPSSTKQDLTIYTVGYGMKSIKALANLLIKNNIEQIIDVRYNVYSENKDFNGHEKNLPLIFAGLGFDYRHIQPFGNSPHIRHLFGRDRKAWRILFFQPFTELQRQAYRRIVTSKKTVLLCAEKDPRKCHRREIGFWLAQGNPKLKVVHL